MKKLFSIFFNPYIGPIIGISFILLAVVIFVIPQFSYENRIELMEKRAVDIINNLKKVRSYYTQNVIKEVKKDGHIKINYDHKENSHTIPLPATLIHDLSEIIPEDGMEIKMYSNYPFPNRKDRVLSSFEKGSLSYLVNNPEKIFSGEVFENAEKRYNVAVADVFYDSSCVSCHNTRVDTPKDNWQIGDVRGVIEVSVPIKESLVLDEDEVLLLLVFLMSMVFVLGIHYSIISIRRTSEHSQIKKELENEVLERTSKLESANKLLNQYKKAVDMSAIVSKTDKHGKITYVNDEFIKISKFSEHELLGKNHNIVRHEDMPEELFEDLWTTIKSKKIWQGQIKNRAKDGTSYYVSSTIVPILNYDDEIEEFLAIRLDVTNILESQISAQRADEAKSTFLANMSHEIRTPLNAIIGFSDLLSSSKDLTAQNKKQADIIHSSANSLLTIINDILDVSKIESGNFEVSLEQTDLYFISEHVIELFSKKANEKHIKLVFDLDNKLPLCILTDGVRLRQVLSNLLSNAIKFTPQKGVVSLKILLLEDIENRVKVRFEIEDSGIGIPEDKLASVFNPFIQVDHKTNRQYEGTGLGLSISTHIIDSLGSKIDVESSVGKGTRFWFDLEFDTCENSFYSMKTYLDSLNFTVIDTQSNIFHYAKRYLSLLGTINDDSRETNVLVCCCQTKDINRLEELRKEYEDIPLLILYEYEDELNTFNLKGNEQALALPFYASKLNDSLEELLRRTNKRNKPNEETISNSYEGNILIAEDNEANQELISYILNGMGLNFVIKNNGKEALDEFMENSYDVVLMDINMPVMDGVESFKQIRYYEKQEGLKETPIIALTANAIKGDREKFLALGMNDYLSKPINVDELKKVFDIYLSDIEIPSDNAQVKDLSDKSLVESEIDISKIVKSLGISENIAKMIVEKFKKDIQNDLDELSKFVETDDIEAVSQKAHYIKNSCLNVALEDVCSLLQELEDKSTESSKKRELFDKISNSINQIIKG